MPGKARVHELAKELGLTSKQIMHALADLGEYVKSPSSVVDGVLVDRIRSSFTGTAGAHSVDVRPGPKSYPKNPFGLGRPATDEGYAKDIPYLRPRVEHRSPMPLSPRLTSTSRSLPPPLPTPKPRREWHRGTPPTGLTEYLLDNLLVGRRGERASAPMPPWRYFEDEVKEADQIARLWATAMLDDLDYEDILDWFAVFPTEIFWMPVSPSNEQCVQFAIELHQAGVKPSDLGWNYRDGDQGTLLYRLSRGLWTVEMVATEVERRRSALP